MRHAWIIRTVSGAECGMTVCTPPGLGHNAEASRREPTRLQREPSASNVRGTLATRPHNGWPGQPTAPTSDHREGCQHIKFSNVSPDIRRLPHCLTNFTAFLIGVSLVPSQVKVTTPNGTLVCHQSPRTRTAPALRLLHQCRPEAAIDVKTTGYFDKPLTQTYPVAGYVTRARSPHPVQGKVVNGDRRKAVPLMAHQATAELRRKAHRLYRLGMRAADIAVRIGYDERSVFRWLQQPEPAPQLSHSPPEWYRDALCAQTDPELFFPQRRCAPALRICARCIVADLCLAFALDRPELQGIWGGTTHSQRLQLRKATL